MAVRKSSNQPQLLKQTVDTFLTASIQRNRVWHRAIRVFQRDIGGDAESKTESEKQHRHDPWPAIGVVAEEIILSELSTRIWASVLVQTSPESDRQPNLAIANGVVMAQTEARNRIARLLLSAPSDAKSTVEPLLKLLGMVERWNDLLLSLFADVEKAGPFAMSKPRFGDYSESATASNEWPEEQTIIDSLTRDLSDGAGRFPANPVFNRKIADAINGCLSQLAP